ncbi:hypothetical protein [Alkalicoccobacillus plakortidis]|uniref:Uncharacterized protein n=1 Tax=Alkalicoccobacillus plakortidis TaxID=444060 RepID=A0ABT0XLM0_9BACI|nr:hypothetical protein [Alkalicoccobacillus plakortidis]MCM2676804.1 hypothetical protein [Alkalicoccobacillus plakortidis]
MRLLSYSYLKKGKMKAIYDRFSDSQVIFCKINGYYFVYYVRWSENDPIVVTQDLIEMEYLLNEEMDTLDIYLTRKRNN